MYTARGRGRAKGRRGSCAWGRREKGEGRGREHIASHLLKIKLLFHKGVIFFTISA